ncbi:transcriptional regulator [Vibrio ichthyoenteri ATCC 700023]|uniref:Transcriptional regulator n=1 Tax=Vibrio ichthyoenteri ATCC 700023 TaxID=870968 RepID=F9S175_9VIBR|nr:AraC family transcriptional regulator [Vibrio ichthyoenteri]EGU42118.1 transcriptional regulator [Vibrio ichthyoenteri ATCC 700023]
MKKDDSVSFNQSTLLPWIELRVAQQSSACYQAHSHDEFSFGIIDSGVADYQNRDNHYRISQGDLVTINPFDVHSCNPEPAETRHSAWSYRMLFVDAEKMGQVQQEVLPTQPGLYTPFTHDLERCDILQQQFNALFQALQLGASHLHAEVCLFEFIAGCFSSHQEKIPPSHQTHPCLAHVREKLLDQVNHNHHLQSLADTAGMSRYQLVRGFKSQFGLPPHAYLMDEKIKRAKQMLKSGQPISDIALQLGFSDQAHFQRQFKRKLAVTPKFYQSHFVPAGSSVK